MPMPACPRRIILKTPTARRLVRATGKLGLSTSFRLDIWGKAAAGLRGQPGRKPWVPHQRDRFAEPRRLIAGLPQSAPSGSGVRDSVSARRAVPSDPRPLQQWLRGWTCNPGHHFGHLHPPPSSSSKAGPVEENLIGLLVGQPGLRIPR